MAPPQTLTVATGDGMVVPRVIADAGDRAARRFLEFQRPHGKDRPVDRGIVGGHRPPRPAAEPLCPPRHRHGRRRNQLLRGPGRRRALSRPRPGQGPCRFPASCATPNRRGRLLPARVCLVRHALLASHSGGACSGAPPSRERRRTAAEPRLVLTSVRAPYSRLPSTAN
jgi:hypothetical protein